MANMKREADFDTGGMEGGKRSRGVGRLEARVLVPSRMAGSVIGKGGANIQKLRTEYSAGVRIPDCPGPERIMSVQVRIIIILSVFSVPQVILRLSINSVSVSSLV